MISVCRRRSVGSKRWWKSSVRSVCSVRERTPHARLHYFFSQKNTDEQNTQRPTETLSQPITQSVTANVSWKASVISVCRRRSVGSKRWWKGSVISVYSVRERNTLCEKKEYFPWEKELPSESHASHLIARVRSISHRVTQKNRTHRVSQRH